MSLKKDHGLHRSCCQAIRLVLGAGSFYLVSFDRIGFSSWANYAQHDLTIPTSDGIKTGCMIVVD